ncbi:hypothetical protein UFOVP218_32 [uncultured Caudovirales phage]|uniref:Uncharacterized protein n=1 Tax=uncultured Caudovirales phage TaxID=2100421 RepID=A0A6J7WL71_9CAUD|nr:hypothetical protein UFOVP218_32 [uncultured Caudovirales phage]
MSAENFIKIFRDKRKSLEEAPDFADYSHWVNTNKTWFNKNRDDLEKMGLSQRVGFVVSEEKANELGVGPAFKQLAEQFTGNSDIGKPIVDTVDGKQVILFSNVPFKDGIERTLDKFFGEGTSSRAKEMGLVKGHIYGFMTGAVLGARDQLYNFLTKSKDHVPIMSENEADYAINFLDTLIRHLQQLDLESAELKTLTSPVFLKYTKSAENFLVELQTEKSNAASAKLVQKLAGRIGGSTGMRGLVNPTSTQEKALQGILQILIEDGSFSKNEILDFKSSPTLKELITDAVLEPIGRISKNPKKITSGNIKLPNEIPIAYVNEEAKRKYRQELKSTISDAKANKQKIQKQKDNIAQVKATLPTIADNGLTNLLSLLNLHLQDVISANMGGGSRSDILNYRTGRFASSVKVERLTTSREGMITAFYTYMKNPYATFSQGGKQAIPGTRDPKLLISKSIREIAAEKVGNRLRAVVI